MSRILRKKLDTVDLAMDAYAERAIDEETLFYRLRALGVGEYELEGYARVAEESRREFEFSKGQFGVGA